MLKHWFSLVVLVAIALGTNSCSYFGQFTRVEPEVVYTTEGAGANGPSIGQVIGGALLSTTGPEVYWHSGSTDYNGRGDYEIAPNVFDLEQLRLTNGSYRTSIRLSVVPRGIVRSITVVSISHSERLRGPSEKSGWSWPTPNHYDGAWRGYTLQIQYSGSNTIHEFEYWVLSSPNKSVTSPY